MHEIDLLTLMSLAENDPERTVCLRASNVPNAWIAHARCAMVYEALIRRKGSPWSVAVPEGSEVQLYSTACMRCGRECVTKDLKPFLR